MLLVKCGECGWEGPENQCLRNWEGLLVCPQCGEFAVEYMSEEDGDAGAAE